MNEALTINEIVNLIATYGWTPVLAGILIWKGKPIGLWLIETFKAAERLKIAEDTIIQLQATIKEMQAILKDNSERIMRLTEQNARLEERLAAAQSVASKTMHQARGRA